MALREILKLDTLRTGAEKSNYSDEWLRDLIRGSVNSGYEESFSSSATWVVNHGLNTDIFTYLCVDNAPTPAQIIPSSMVINSVNQITLTFSSPQSGTVKVMFGFSGWVFPAQSEVGLPSDENWDDGIVPDGMITPSTTIADAIDLVNQYAIQATGVVGQNLQACYDVVIPGSESISVDVGKPIEFRSPVSGAARDVLFINQENANGGVPLTVYNDPVAGDPSIKLTGSTRIISSANALLEITTLTAGNILFDSADDVVAELGDSIGSNAFIVSNSSSTPVFTVDSIGDVGVTGKVNPYGITESAFYNFLPQTGEVDSPSERPQLYVNSISKHLMFVDIDGLEFDVSQSLLYSNMIEDIFEIDATIVAQGYVDLSSPPLENSEFVYLNGMCLTKNTPLDTWDYTVGPTGGDPTYRIRFNTGAGVELVEGGSIHVKYLIDYSVDTPDEDVFEVSNPAQLTYTLSHAPIAKTEFVMLNGLTGSHGFDYTLAGSDVIISALVTLTIGDKIHVKYRYT